MAHDFNNMLNAIGSPTYILKKRLLPGVDDVADHLRAIEMAVEDGSSMVERLRRMGRQVEESPEEVDLNSLVKDVVLLTKPKWYHDPRKRGRSIQVNTSFQAEPRVVASPSDLREVLTNLIFNAVDAMPQGGNITVSTSVKDGWALCQVEDSGVGISPEIRERIFDPFFTTKGHGTGLGLSVSYAIVQKCGGDMEVVSEPGQGTTFSMKLPLGDTSVCPGQA